jgi:hypothetical protein
MSAFNHILTLVAFVFAVALAQLLVRISALIAARERVAYSGLSALAMANAILLVYANWLAMWELRTATDWRLLPITVIFLFSLSVCFISTLSAPQEFGDKLIDLEAFYWRQRRTYFAAWFVCECLAILGNQVFPSPSAARLSVESLTSLAMFPPILLALLVPKRWAQWVGGGALLVLDLTFLIVFERQL